MLGAMLVSEPTLTRVIDEVKLNAEDFYLDKHAAIFRCVHDLYAASKPVDELSVSEALVQRNPRRAAIACQIRVLQPGQQRMDGSLLCKER